MANPQESALHYPLGEQLPDIGGSLEVAPGVRWVRMRLPFALDHINLWLLRDHHQGQDGWTLVDCGIDDPGTRAAWDQVFASDALQGLPLLRVMVTHMHPDHIGLAHWLTQRWSTPGRECRLWISATDFNAAHNASRGTRGQGGEAAARFFALHGLTDPGALGQVRARGSYYANMVPEVPASFRRLLDGMAVAIGGHAWTALAGHGHAPEHISLHAATLRGEAAPQGVLISGDMVLPRISTNVSVYDIEPEADPLPLYLQSVRRLLALPEGTLVLPSHGRPFTGLHERVRQLVSHHDERFEDVLQACASGPKHAAELLDVLFKRKLDLHQTTFAMGESIAHLHALASMGRLVAVDGSDGVRRFALQA